MNEKKKNESKQKRGLNWFFKGRDISRGKGGGGWGGLNIPFSKRESREYR